MRRVPFGMPNCGGDIVHRHRLLPGERLEGTVDDRTGLTSCPKNIATYRRTELLHQVRPGEVRVWAIRREGLETLPHAQCCRLEMMNQCTLPIGNHMHRHLRNVPLLLHRQFAICLADALRTL